MTKLNRARKREKEKEGKNYRKIRKVVSQVRNIFKNISTISTDNLLLLLGRIRAVGWNGTVASDGEGVVALSGGRRRVDAEELGGRERGGAGERGGHCSGYGDGGGD